MKVGGILFVALGAFLLVAGITYGVWGYELSGTVFLCVLGVAFMYLAHMLLHAARDEPRETEDEHATVSTEDGGHGPQALSRQALEPVPVTGHASAPALTPLLFALAGGLVASGLVFTRWLVIAGALVLASVAIAWLLETAPRRAGHGGEHDDHAAQHDEAQHDQAHEAPADH